MIRIIFCWLFLTLTIAVNDDGCRENCILDAESNGERVYTLYNNKSWMVEMSLASTFILMTCYNTPLTDPAVPLIFPSLSHTPDRVLFNSCPLPDSSIRDALLALNADSVPKRLTLRDVPQSVNISRRHFDGFFEVYYLDVSSHGADVSIEKDALNVFHNLTELVLNNVRMNGGALPPSLLRLDVFDDALETFGPEWTSKLTVLKSLIVIGLNIKDVSISTNASDISLISLRGRTLETGAFNLPKLKEAAISGVGQKFAIAGQWDKCKRLKYLMISDGPDVSFLPDAWLSNLTSLTNVSFHSLGIESLPNNLFVGTKELLEFNIKHSNISEIPEYLFRDAKFLVTLDLSHNRIDHVPFSLLDQLPSLTHLVLSYNRLASVEWAAAVPGAGGSLRYLLVDNNPLGDTCEESNDDLPGSVKKSRKRVDGINPSPLRDLRGLTTLSLVRTGARTVCLDWRLLLAHLTTLDLSDNDIADLDASSFMWVRKEESTVYLQNNPITSILYSMEDYQDAVRINDGLLRPANTGVTGGGSVTIDLLGCPLVCDCASFWFTAAYMAGGPPPRVSFSPAPCARPPPAEACPLLVDECFPQCECVISTRRPLDPPLATCSNVSRQLLEYDRPLSLKMERAGLNYVPKLGRPANLSLAHNSIVDSSLADLAVGVEVLDLRNNTITLQSASVASALFSRASSVRLSGNPLSCGCDSVESVALVQQHQAQIPDYYTVQCSDGTAVWRVSPSELCHGGSFLWWMVLPLTGLMVCAVAAMLVWPQLVLRLKVFAKRVTPTANDSFDYDVFVSFAHPDHEACGAIVRRLEKARRKVCVHYRDWTVGDWIPEQISRSVRSSRRTLALVSPHYCDSRWTPAEVREATADDERLIVVFLTAVGDDQLGRVPELKRHVAKRTYIEYSDPLFWPRLLAALPVSCREADGAPLVRLDTSASA